MLDSSEELRPSMGLLADDISDSWDEELISSMAELTASGDDSSADELSSSTADDTSDSEEETQPTSKPSRGREGISKRKSMSSRTTSLVSVSASMYWPPRARRMICLVTNTPSPVS